MSTSSTSADSVTDLPAMRPLSHCNRDDLQLVGSTCNWVIAAMAKMFGRSSTAVRRQVRKFFGIERPPQTGRHGPANGMYGRKHTVRAKRRIGRNVRDTNRRLRRRDRLTD